MRRFLLTLTVLSVPGWSQPAQQSAQPPIVVKVEMPPTNPWVHLVEIVVPGIIGAGLALFGVWLTNKNNAATNAANRQHALDIEKIKDQIAAEAKSRDNRWEFRKDVYLNLITATSSLLVALAAMETPLRAILRRTWCLCSGGSFDMLNLPHLQWLILCPPWLTLLSLR
jgi:hypothetical protein